jgi:hypothetical protein
MRLGFLRRKVATLPFMPHFDGDFDDSSHANSSVFEWNGAARIDDCRACSV